MRGPDFALVYDAGSNDDLARGPNNRMLAFMQTAAPTLTTVDHIILSHPRDASPSLQLPIWIGGRPAEPPPTFSQPMPAPCVRGQDPTALPRVPSRFSIRLLSGGIV